MTHSLQTLGSGKAMLDVSTWVEFKLCDSGPCGSSRLFRKTPLLMPDYRHLLHTLPWAAGQLRTELAQK